MACLSRSRSECAGASTAIGPPSVPLRDFRCPHEVELATCRLLFQCNGQSGPWRVSPVRHVGSWHALYTFEGKSPTVDPSAFTDRLRRPSSAACRRRVAHRLMDSTGGRLPG